MSIEPDINLTVDEDIVLWHSISRGDKKAFDDFFLRSTIPYYMGIAVIMCLQKTPMKCCRN